jgi:hypothetical protein
MSIEVLCSADDKPIRQRPAHDLESIFYIIIYLCTIYTGPNGKRRSNAEAVDSNLPILHWFNQGVRYRDMANTKIGQLTRFKVNFVEHLTPYFSDIIPHLHNLLDVIFPASALADDPKGPAMYRNWEKCDATHDGILDALRATYDTLPDCDSEVDNVDSSPTDVDPPSPTLSPTLLHIRGRSKRRSNEENLPEKSSGGSGHSGTKRVRSGNGDHG